MEIKQLEAQVLTQAGLEILKLVCPTCGRHLAISGPGRAFCPCGLVADLVKPQQQGS